ncbi:ribulose-phosphate 3-epimerase [Edaphobacter bradus]|uniref:ribulose-phosphate 3-epimerase n=1 Tax=Edaphobacter bradus TaxID=2259016 RepID=UPI0021E0F9AC|nr:ribulose-phosphate 3-epimerase [Edaphobacter bradus]
MVELAFSILASDFAHLADEVAAAERGGGSIVHVDIMDGHFVPNITFGPPMVEALRPVTKLPLDCHLMIENPDEYIPAFASAGADLISVHQETCRHLHRTLQLISEHGVLPGVVLNPATPVETLIEVLPMVHYVLVMSVNPGFGGQKFLPLALRKIAHLAELREEMGLKFRIEVDGGVAPETVASVVEAGAEMLVAGSAVFTRGKTEQSARKLLKLARAAEAAQS